MVQFDELQKLWQSQRPAAPDPRILADTLRRFRIGQDRIYAFKLVAVVGWFSFGVYHARHDLTLLGGLVLVVATALAVLFLDWRNRRAIARLDFTQPSLGFVRAAIIRLNLQREPYGKAFWLLLFVVGAVLNAILLEVLHSQPFRHRILPHVLACAYPFLCYRLARWIRRHRFESECRPVLERLIVLERSLEEHAQ
jgi:hypothetical protein